MASGICLTTERLTIRPPQETDRDRFVELFVDPSFMVFSGDVCDVSSAHERFDRMLNNTSLIRFSKRPVIERCTGDILGYAGAARFTFEGEQRLEFGYRLCLQARGKGYATEAAMALLDSARATWTGVLLAMIDPANEPSIRVINKLGFTYSRMIEIDSYEAHLYELDISTGIDT